MLVAAALAGGLALLALPVAFSDGRRLLEIVSSVRPQDLAALVFLTALSYLAMSRSYQGIACAAGTDLPFREWVRITLVSNTANYLVTRRASPASPCACTSSRNRVCGPAVRC